MNDFRSKILSGKPAQAGLLAGKQRRNAAAGDNLQNVPVPRTESRTANHRHADRHRRIDEEVTARHGGADHRVHLINLSGGGAMIEAPFRPELWDRVDLELGPDQSVECAVRWLRGGRIGLEFAHETCIDADKGMLTAVLREAVDRNFAEAAPDAPAAQSEPGAQEPVVLGASSRRSEPRHPLIWIGDVHYDHDTKPVRLRNVSATGAMIEIADTLPVGAELHLDLGEAGALFATVSWVRGDQVGLAFASRFDLMKLAAARPQVAPRRWTKPDYLRDDSGETSPWASEWGRLSVDDLRRTLGR